MLAKFKPLSTWHPHAASYPLLEGEEYEAFKEDINRNGQREAVKYRIMGGKKQGLDGRNRERACRDLGIRCRTQQVTVRDDKVKAYIDSQNLHRRHLTREQRQARAQAMRVEGQSSRQIAANLGVSQTTVINDLKDANISAGEQNCSPDNSNGSRTSAIPPAAEQGTVIGQDGKSYPANKRPDADRVTNQEERRQPRKKPGKPLFDDRTIDTSLKKLAKAFHERAKAVGETTGYFEVRQMWEALQTAWKRWQLEQEKPR